MNNITVGQILKRKDGLGKQKVLGVCGEVVFLSVVDHCDIIEPQFFSVRDMETAFLLPKTKWQPDGYYWTVTSDGQVKKLLWQNDAINEFRYQCGNCFEYDSDARAYKQRLIEMGNQ